MSDPVTVDLDCYAGYQGEETPRRFRLGDRWVEIAAVVERWQTPEYRCFRVRTVGGESYTLRQDVRSGEWELTV